MEVEIILFSVRQLPDKATEHLHGERGGGGQAGVRDNEIGNSGFLFSLQDFSSQGFDLFHIFRTCRSFPRPPEASTQYSESRM